MSKRVVAVPLQGGKVAPNPQFQDSLKQMGLDPNAVLQRVQEEVKKYGKYPIQKVEVEVVPPAKYDVKVHLPPIGDLFLKLFGKDTGAHDARNEVIGDLTFEQLVEIAVLKRDELKSRSLKAAVKQLLSTCKAMGITVGGKPAGEVLKEVDAGKYDEIINKFEKLWSQ
ncbi:50S ribosomal protein L11 [Pyrobaculum neutrophilum]|uniref:Large ribosomal subunit protein uL11 n=1 Tax=Pyrobaculum neutrophilum (strain DSM 2338 / JCM 9278 / NBRC 100436 / V24Sta) TaxID=444157 RepID=B1YAC9_PYRNV|nr:50S ribosomal protein L11 [Pyrobaculum neutrophilum]ACB40578.1 ribosomal protein L11 [Pyrobaculum neutrophilum V24Sta]